MTVHKALKPAESKPAGRPKKKKQPVQHTPEQRVMLVGPTGKRTFVWRPW